MNEIRLKHTSGTKHIRNNTARVGQRRGTKGTRKEAQDNQRLDVLRARRAGIERRQGHVRGEEQNLPAIKLGKGSPEQRAEGETAHKQRNAQNGHGRADAERHDDLGDAARVGGRDEGDGQGRDGLQGRDGPLLGRRELGRVARVDGEEVDQVRRLGGALAGVLVVEHLGRDAGLVEDVVEVRGTLGRSLGLDVDGVYCRVIGRRDGRRGRRRPRRGSHLMSGVYLSWNCRFCVLIVMVSSPTSPSSYHHPATTTTTANNNKRRRREKVLSRDCPILPP